MASILARVFRWLHASQMNSLGGIPGPTPTFPFGTALDFLGKQPWEVCADYGKTHGGVTLIWMFGKPALVLNDPELIGQALETRSVHFYKDSPCNALRPVITDNCPFICNGEDWAFKRANHPLQLDDFDAWRTTQVRTLRQALIHGIERLTNASASTAIDLLESIQRLSFDAFAVAVWGRTLGDDAYCWFLTLGRMGDRRIKLDLLLPLLPPLNPIFWLHRRHWYNLFDQLIAEAKQDPNPERTDLLSVWLRRGSKLSATGLKDSLANVFYGGVFSVTSAITTTLYLLAQHPAEAERLQRELNELASRRPDFDWPALAGCLRLDQVLREALRYLTPVPIYFRNTLTTQSTEFAGHVLPPNTVLFITNWFLHRSPAHWKDPDRFDPDRWSSSVIDANPLGSGHFFPFGRGPRMCVGLPFAIFYMKLALAILLSHAKVEIDPSQAYQQGFFFGVMMPQGLKARFTARADPA
jgi:cytochrome P450